MPSQNSYLKKGLILIIVLASLLLASYGAISSFRNYIKSFFHEEVLFIYTSSNYPDEKKYKTEFQSERRTTLVFGPYMPNVGSGGGAFGGNYHYYKGPIEGKEIVALWKVPTHKKMLFYYARSNPGEGIIRAPRDGHTAYHVGISFGPMVVSKSGLTPEQFKNAEVAAHSISGKPVYWRWGEWHKIYYTTGIFIASELKKIPRKFHEIDGIAITKHQYDKLHKRCKGEWKAVKCFMDESFPHLMPKQLRYIKSREHAEDDNRLAGKHPKPVPYRNPWK
jgi:hypothetical protein